MKYKYKVLWINDDFIDHQDTFKSNFKRQEIKLEMSLKFIFKKNIDLVYIDYGWIGGEYQTKETEKHNIEILRKYYLNKIPMCFTGGLSQFYEKYCKIDFPKLKFLHKIPSIELGDKIWYVYHKLGEK